MADENTQLNTDGQKTESNGTGGAPTPSPAAEAGDALALKKMVEKLQADSAKASQVISALNEENKKWRTRNDEETRTALEAKKAAETKLLQQGEHLALLEAKKTEVESLQKQLADLTPKAQRYETIEKRQREALETAKAAGGLPNFVVKAIDMAANSGDVDGAHDILNEYRASQTGAKPAPAPNPAPAPGASPSSPAPRKGVEQMSAAELKAFQAADPAAYNAAVGGAPNGHSSFDPTKWIEGFTARRG